MDDKNFNLLPNEFSKSIEQNTADAGDSFDIYIVIFVMWLLFFFVSLAIFQPNDTYIYTDTINERLTDDRQNEQKWKNPTIKYAVAAAATSNALHWTTI